MNRMVLAALLALGCGGVEDLSKIDTATAYGAAASVDGAQLEAGITASLATQLGSASYATVASIMAAAPGATALFTPAGCATATTRDNAVSYTFSNCTGQFGLAKLNGSLTATFTRSDAGAIYVSLVATGFKINTVSVDLAATTIFASTTRASGMVMSSTKATNARGETATHDGSYTASWDASCLSLDGSFLTTLGSTGFTTLVSGFRVCSGMCPDASGTVKVSGSSGSTITIYYTNGATAEVVDDQSHRAMILLACGAA